MSVAAPSLLPAELEESLRLLREDLHRHPELSFREHRTTDRLVEFLHDAGIEDVQRLEETGAVARIPGRGRGPTVAVRGDIDALPISENSGLPFSSENPGVMHACGHDVHATWAVGAGLLLAEEPAEGDVLIVLQPAEETGEGAARVLETGMLDDVAMIFGAHVDPRWTVGQVVADVGAVAAATDEFEIHLTGAGGHGARPQLGRDPVVAGAALVGSLQTIVSRRVTPGEPAVVTVGEFHGGTAANVIPDAVRLTGTLRSTTTATRQLLRDEVVLHTRAIGEGHGVEATVEFVGGTPPLVNEALATALAREVVIEVMGSENLRTLTEPNMGGEDFAYYLERIPGCFLRIGSRFPDDPVVGAHTPRFLARTEAVSVGAVLLAESARRAARTV